MQLQRSHALPIAVPHISLPAQKERWQCGTIDRDGLVEQVERKWLFSVKEVSSGSVKQRNVHVTEAGVARLMGSLESCTLFCSKGRNEPKHAYFHPKYEEDSAEEFLKRKEVRCYHIDTDRSTKTNLIVRFLGRKRAILPRGEGENNIEKGQVVEVDFARSQIALSATARRKLERLFRITIESGNWAGLGTEEQPEALGFIPMVIHVMDEEEVMQLEKIFQ